MKKLTGAALLLVSILGFSACSSGTSSTTSEYHKISADDAKEMLDENPNAILLDVREQTEYDEKHIKGAQLMPLGEIEDRAETELLDKNAIILVHCRSGKRSKKAADKLIELGYTKIYDFGGIIDYPYETVSK